MKPRCPDCKEEMTFLRDFDIVNEKEDREFFLKTKTNWETTTTAIVTNATGKFYTCKQCDIISLDGFKFDLQSKEGTQFISDEEWSKMQDET